jgi:hypothetical protein
LNASVSALVSPTALALKRLFSVIFWFIALTLSEAMSCLSASCPDSPHKVIYFLAHRDNLFGIDITEDDLVS